MSYKPHHFDFRKALLRRSMVKVFIGLIELFIYCGALFWLWTSKQGQHLWVWVAVGLPLFLAYVFIGGYVRLRLGLIKTSSD